MYARAAHGRSGGQLGAPLDPPDRWAVRIGHHWAAFDFSRGLPHYVLERGQGRSDGIFVFHPLLGPTEDGLEPEDWESLVDAPFAVKVERLRSGFRLTAHGASHVALVIPARLFPYTEHMIEKVPPDLSKFMLAPMPDCSRASTSRPGDKVEAGQALAVVEAMKMENILRAERAGTVKAANFVAGDSLAVDARDSGVRMICAWF